MVLREVPAENITRPIGRNEVIGLLFRLTIFGAVTYFTIKWMVDAIDPTRKQKVEAQKQVRQLVSFIRTCRDITQAHGAGEARELRMSRITHLEIIAASLAGEDTSKLCTQSESQ